MSERDDLITWVGGMKYPEDRDVLERLAEDSLDAAIEEAAAPLLTAISEAYTFLTQGALAVICPACGSKPGKDCYGNGPMPAHEARRALARDSAFAVLHEALKAWALR